MPHQGRTLNLQRTERPVSSTIQIRSGESTYGPLPDKSGKQFAGRIAGLSEEGGAAAMAHIDRRNRGGTIRYVARYIDPAGRERSKSFIRRADAQKYLTEIEAAKLKGTWVDPRHGRTRFRDWHEEWWGSVVNLRPSTRLRDETYLRRYVLPRFGDMPLDAIRQREVRAWVAWLLAQGWRRPPWSRCTNC
jgi:Phage integrase, N-terminal SAM-like domain